MADPMDAEMLAVLQWLWAVQPGAGPDARPLLLDTIGCAIAGAAEPCVAELFRRGAALDPGVARLPGSPHGLSATAFARAFATAACWHEACEGLALAHGRPGLHAIPAALGPALVRPTTLAALLGAIATGYEVGGRMGAVCRIRPGMHVDGTWGSFGAAAALCRLLGATAEQALAALNHAACHLPFSLYHPIPAGSTARNAYAGHGAAHGMASALAALSGLGGPAGGMAEMRRLSLGAGPAALPGPGRWLLAEGYLKPYPAVRHVHYGAAAAEAWRGDPAGIDAITLHTYPEALTYCANRAPATPIEAQFSLSYGVAHTLAHGRLDPAAYAPVRLASAEVRRLEALVALRTDPALGASGRRGATLEVWCGGAAWRRTVDAVPGDPMPRDQVRDKFTAYAARVIGSAHARAIADRVLDGPADAAFRLDP